MPNNCQSSKDKKESVNMETKFHKFSDYMLLVTITILVYLLTLPESCFATSLEKQLETVDALANDKAKKVFLTLAFVISSVISVVKGNVKMIFVIVGILIVIAISGEWISSGMTIGSSQ